MMAQAQGHGQVAINHVTKIEWHPKSLAAFKNEDDPTAKRPAGVRSRQEVTPENVALQAAPLAQPHLGGLHEQTQNSLSNTTSRIWLAHHDENVRLSLFTGKKSTQGTVGSLNIADSGQAAVGITMVILLPILLPEWKSFSQPG